MTKAKKQSEQAVSIRALATIVDRSPSAVHEWISKPSWPFGPPPWDSAIVARIQAWSEDELRPDRDAERVERRANRKLIPAPGLAIDPDELQRPPFDLPTRIGAKLWNEFSDRDRQHLARLLTVALGLAMADHLATGGEKILATAPASYWQRVLKEVPADAIAGTWDKVILCFIGDRFIGQEWWKDLPGNPGKPPAKWLSECRPLEGSAAR